MSVKHPVPEDPATEWYFWVDEKKSTIKDKVKQMFSRIWRRKK
jgi:hypothetical protein